MGAFDASRDMTSNNREIFSLGIISEYPGTGPQQKPDSYGYSDTFNAKLRCKEEHIANMVTIGTGILPLAPPHTDIKAKSAAQEKSSSSQSSQFSVGDQRLEESTLRQESTHLQL